MATETIERRRPTSQRLIRMTRQRRRQLSHLPSSNGTTDGNSTTPHTQPKKKLLLSDLGWTKEQILESYYRFQRYADILDAPGMESYDEL